MSIPQKKIEKALKIFNEINGGNGLHAYYNPFTSGDWYADFEITGKAIDWQISYFTAFDVIELMKWATTPVDVKTLHIM